MESLGKSTRLTATGDGSPGPARLLNVHWLAGATAGTITIRDGGASGDVLTIIDTPAEATASDNMSFGDAPLLAKELIHVTLENVTAVTLHWK